MILVGGGALVLGLLVGMCAATQFGGNYGRMSMMHESRYESRSVDTDVTPRDSSGHDMHMMMEGMMGGLAGKTGAEFDAAFLREMIVHHEGAVEMAEAALVSAEDQRIKVLATAIIAAQEKEIADMKSWQEPAQQ